MQLWGWVFFFSFSFSSAKRVVTVLLIIASMDGWKESISSVGILCVGLSFSSCSIFSVSLPTFAWRDLIFVSREALRDPNDETITSWSESRDSSFLKAELMAWLTVKMSDWALLLSGKELTDKHKCCPEVVRCCINFLHKVERTIPGLRQFCIFEQMHFL